MQVLPDAEIAAEEEEVEEEEEEEEAPAARPSPARRAVRQASSAAEDAAEDVEEEAEEAAPAFDLKSFFGGGGRGAPKAVSCRRVCRQAAGKPMCAPGRSSVAVD